MTTRTFYPPTESDIPLHGWHPYSDMHRERMRAHAKHDGNGGSMERKPFDDPAWLPVLVEEIGEVARVLCDAKLGVLDGDMKATLRKELVQVAAMTAAWIDAIDAAEPKAATAETDPAQVRIDEARGPGFGRGLYRPVTDEPDPAGIVRAVNDAIAARRRREGGSSAA